MGRDPKGRGGLASEHGSLRPLVEAAWLRGDRRTALEHLEAARASPAAGRFARWGGELALWAARLGLELDTPASAPDAVKLELDGDWRGAIRAWRELEAPYESALAALPGDDAAARQAQAVLHNLGASAAVRTFARERPARGERAMRGPRRSTLVHPAGLTRREQEVLEQLATGATNPAIAAALHLSERTVAHHVSAILAKLGAATRLTAIEQARSRGLLARWDGPQTKIGREDRGVRLAVVVHEHELLAKLVFEVPEIGPRPLLDRGCRRRMVTGQAHQLILVHAGKR